MVWLEGLGKLRNAITSSGIEPATFRLVAQRLNQLRYRMLHKNRSRQIFHQKIGMLYSLDI
jgi:hypothetical protein